MSSNHVAIDRSGGTVAKTFRSVIACDNERKMLRLLDGSGMTPPLLSGSSDSLTLGYIEGDSLLEVLEQADKNEAELGRMTACLVALLDWLTALADKSENQGVGFPVLEDLQLRNFIAADNGLVVGMDFESWHYGEREDNYARLLAVVGSYRLDNKAMVEYLSALICDRVRDDPRLSYHRFAVLAEQRRSELMNLRRIRQLLRSSTAVIIAGGQGRRMGVRPKALLVSGEYTFLDRILYALSGFDTVVLSVAQQGQLAGLGLPCRVDIHPDCGPMGGLHTALSYATTPLVFVTPCDTPRMNVALITALYACLTDEVDCVIPQTDDGVHPLCGIYRRSILPQLEQQLASGCYKLRRLLDTVRTQYLSVEGEAAVALCNINTPEQYSSLAD